MSALDIQYIVASFNKYLEDNFSGTIHPGGVDNPNDAGWIEPWLSFDYDATRANEKSISMTANVNCFAKRGQTPQVTDTYAVVALASEVADLLRNGFFSVLKWGGNERNIGCGRFRDPEAVDLGTVTHAKTGVPLQQWNVTAEGSAAPID